MTGPFQDEPCGLRSACVVNGGLELVLNNTLKAIEDGRRRVLDFLAGQELAEVAHHRLEVVFEELVSNTIRHGFARNSDQSIHVRVEPRPGLVEFTFEDDGIPFNPLEATPPGPLTSIETAKIGGMGIPLVAKFCARLSYERPAPGDSQPGFAPSNRLIVAIAT
jgi:sigma-B regulation protein RsbU (phosphoserine phosphatase)